MSDQPKVSVTIPSYNHARFLNAAIESVLAQTYRPLELVIVDDGSTDGSLQIAQDYARRYPDIVRVGMHAGHSNRGISATVNLCFQLITGSYWMGLPSDDMLHPHKVAEQVAFLEQHPELGWVYCYALCVDEEGRARADLGLFGTDIRAAPDQVERLILGNIVPGMTVLMRRAAVAEIEPHDDTLVYSDWDFWVRLAAHHRAGFSPRARVFYRVHGYNTSVGTEYEANMQRGREVLLKLRRVATTIGGALTRPRTRALLELQLTFYAYGANDEQAAAQHLAAAFATDPTLQHDLPYLSRWLKHCYTMLVLRPDRRLNLSFSAWLSAHLPGHLETKFVQAFKRRLASRAFSPAAVKYYRAAAHWQGRRKLLSALWHDRRSWHEPELFSLYVGALVGTRIRRQLRRWLAPRHDIATGR